MLREGDERLSIITRALYHQLGEMDLSASTVLV